MKISINENRTVTGTGAPVTPRQILETRVESAPDSVAFQYIKKKQTVSVTCGQFWREVNAMGVFFYRHGLYGKRIAVLGENSYEEAGACYNSGGAVGRVLDLYKAAAPSIDLLCPDIYVSARQEYRRVAGRYARADNPLFVPESSPHGIANAMNMMEAFADFGCIGYACFGGSGTLDIQGQLLPEAVMMPKV